VGIGADSLNNLRLCFQLKKSTSDHSDSNRFGWFIIGRPAAYLTGGLYILLLSYVCGAACSAWLNGKAHQRFFAN